MPGGEQGEEAYMLVSKGTGRVPVNSLQSNAGGTGFENKTQLREEQSSDKSNSNSNFPATPIPLPVGSNT